MEILTAPLEIGTENLGFSAQFLTKKGPGNFNTEENGKTTRKKRKKNGRKRKKTEENGKKPEKIGSDTVPATPFAKPRQRKNKQTMSHGNTWGLTRNTRWRVPNPPGANPLVAERGPWRCAQSGVRGGQQPNGNPYRFLSFLLHTWQPPRDPNSHSWGRLFQLPGG